MFVEMDAMDDCFFYFGFGSNLLAARIQLENPTAVFHTTARLSDYRLDFDRMSHTWRGASATVIPSPGDHVWGVVWLIKWSEVTDLDNQEGVHCNIYKPITVTATSVDGIQLKCRTYMLVDVGYGDHKPSPQYLDIIVKGAEEHRLPDYYIDKLRNIEHNGYVGPHPLYDAVMTKHQCNHGI